MPYTVLEQLKIRLRQFHMESVEQEDGETEQVLVFDMPEENPVLEQLLEQAKSDIVNCRHYPSFYTEEQIAEDLLKMVSLQINLVIYDYNKEGIDFEESHTEPGVTRAFSNRDELLGTITPFVSILS